MSDLLIQSLGLALLLLGLGLGYWHWVRSRLVQNWQATFLLMLLVGTLVGGLIGSMGWWAGDPRSFSWLLPPLASRMLAAAAWSFAVVSFLALQHPVYQRIRLALIMLLLYFVPLVVSILFFHLDRFDFAAPITYAFFIIVGFMTVLTLWYLFRQPQFVPEQPQDTAPSDALSRSWLLIVAVVMAVWGAALFVTDSGPSDLIWVWPGDLLSSRLISVMLLSIAAGALYAVRRADTTRIMMWILVVYGTGVTAANLWSALSNKPIKGSYAVAFALMAIGSAVMLFRTSKVRAEEIRQLQSP